MALPLPPARGRSLVLTDGDGGRRVEEARAVRIEDELARRGISLRGRGGERCGPCPVCGGTDRYSINVKKQVWNCRGCTTGGDVVALVQHIDGSDFMEAVATLVGAVPALGREHERAQQPKKTYFDYHNAHGVVAYQVERTDYYDGREKKFSQRRPDPARPGEWLWNLGGVRPVPYRLPGVIEAAANGHLILIAEGEAKVDLLWSWNIPATCNSGGAQKWKVEHSAYLSGADVVILPDNDPAGRLHLDAVAVSLKEAGATVRVLDLPGLKPKGDIIDWERAGGTAEQLRALIDSDARPWRPSERLEVNSEAFARNGAQRREQETVPARVTDAATFIKSYVPISYTLGGILPSGYLYGNTGVRSHGKTAIATAASFAVITGDENIFGCKVRKGRVAYVVMENPTDFKMKLAANCYLHNLQWDEIATLLAIVDGSESPEQIFAGLRLDAEKNGKFQLVNYDTFQAGFARHGGGGEFNDNAGVLKFLIRLRAFTELPGLPSMLVAFQPTKNATEDELFPYGGGSIINELDGNLTTWKGAPYQVKLWQNKVRGPEFEPLNFRIDLLSCPGIVDVDGVQINLPVARPMTDLDVKEREVVEDATSLKLLQAVGDAPNASQHDLAAKIMVSAGTVNGRLALLHKHRLIDKILNKYFLTERGKKLFNSKT